jgi:phosphonate transport system substrate-binding protein
MFVIRRPLFALLALGFLAGCGRHGQSDVSGDSGGAVRLEVVSQGPQAETAAAWAPIVADLHASAGLDIKPSYSPDGPAMVEALRGHTADLGWLSSEAALQAVRTTDAEVFARPVPLAGGRRAVLVVAPKSRVTLARVLTCDRKLSLGLGEPLSVGASLAPEAYLFAPKAFAPAKCFRRLRRAPGASNLDEVAAGRLDAAVVDAAWLEAARREGKLTGQVTEIWRSPPLPVNPLIWRKDLDPAVKEKLRQFFLTYGQNDAAQRARLAAVSIAAFVPADDTHLLPAREMEAAHLWLEALARGDKAKITETRRTYDAVIAEREDLEARTRAPATAQ